MGSEDGWWVIANVVGSGDRRWVMKVYDTIKYLRTVKMYIECFPCHTHL